MAKNKADPAPGKDKEPTIILDEREPVVGPLVIRPLPLPKAMKLPTGRRPYWCGVLPGGPYQRLSAGGKVFNGMTLERHADPTLPKNLQAAQGRVAYLGEIQFWTDMELQAVKEGVARKIVRDRFEDVEEAVVGGGSPKVIRRRNQDVFAIEIKDENGKWVPNPHYDPDPEHDKPLGNYIFIVPLDAAPGETPNLPMSFRDVYPNRSTPKDWVFSWGEGDKYAKGLPPPVVPLAAGGA